MNRTLLIVLGLSGLAAWMALFGGVLSFLTKLMGAALALLLQLGVVGFGLLFLVLLLLGAREEEDE